MNEIKKYNLGLGLKPQCFAGTFLVYFASWLLCVVLARILPKPLKDLVQ